MLVCALMAGGVRVALAQETVPETRVHGGAAKIVVFRDNARGIAAADALNARHVIDYPDRKLYIVPGAVAGSLTAAQRAPFSMRSDLNRIFLRGRSIDTSKPIAPVPPELAQKPSPAARLYLLQFAGPIKGAWLDEIKAQGGVEIVTYLANDGYLVRADGAALAKLRGLVRRGTHLQFLGAFHPAYRIHPSLAPGGAGEVKVTVQLVDHPGVTGSLAAIRAKATRVIRDAWRVAPYVNLRIVVPEKDLASIAKLPDVINVEPWVEPKLFGELQGQIVAGQVNVAGTQPSAPGYLAWLNGLGFTSNFGFSVNVSDGGFDRGMTSAANVHPDLLDAASNSRVSYVQRVSGTSISTSPGNNVDTDGHGTINVAIVGGLNSGTGSAFEDGNGYQYGLGVAPYALVGSSRIFAPNWTNPDHTVLTDAAYTKGARISSNSWGTQCSGSGGCCPSGVLSDYTADSQEFDALTRDARPAGAPGGGLAGNQEILIVFAAGNQGTCANEELGNDGATAKNTLVVGAGENFNQAGTDGCGITNASADNAQDIASFSSAGPVQDGRVKPDIMAPGTHIRGAASQHGSYNGSGVCDQYHPAGQTLYAWSSGTSHSTPAVAGAAALVRQWFLNQGSAAPSPAMVKAYLMGAARRMTGVGANDTLPSNAQGMGRMNLARSFDGALRVLVDQTTILGATGETFQSTGFIPDTGLPFRVTLAWTDAPGPTVGNAWINDLDLEVQLDSGGGPVLYRGNNFSGEVSQSGGSADGANNVENVWLPAGTTGTYTVTVRASNIAGDGVPNVGDGTDQDFALVIYNGSDAVCGDGAIGAPEACDDGGTAPGDGCDGSCQIETGWNCAGEPSACTEICGDSLIVGAEGCDDGGTAPGDGCDGSCQIESGWSCGGAPSVCSEVCGDGIITASEGCDDGGTVPGDGCDGSCQVEPGFVCNGQPSICSDQPIPTLSLPGLGLFLILLLAGARYRRRRSPVSRPGSVRCNP